MVFSIPFSYRLRPLLIGLRFSQALVIGRDLVKIN
jgi:hypothetical protein